MNGLKKTPLHKPHLEAGGRMVPFAGWEMPVSYGSITGEHQAVRTGAGLFDVSHMGRFRLSGPRAGQTLDYLVTGSATALEEGRWIYTLLLNERGTVLDDLLAGFFGGDFLLVVNAANSQSDFRHMEHRMARFGSGATLTDESDLTAMPAVQGPESRALLERVLGLNLSALGFYRMMEAGWEGARLLVSRTGYTGELGYEVFVPSHLAGNLWRCLLDQGAVPCGLGARDTLRLEMGYPLYGHELDEDHTPLEAGLGWVVDLEKEDFIGKTALAGQKKQGVKRLLRGVRSTGRAFPRPGYRLTHQGREAGTILSGGPSPSLGYGIGTAYLPKELANPGTVLEMELRGRTAPVTVVKFPFYNKGTARD
ncbi:MAG: glycine cleavage system aminomethyltransferase GcvT [Gemmatimonadota bacterium]|nr:glycine cleavage system aminomethyltransferase GcvT [Gemmatimonadota bacterium]